MEQDRGSPSSGDKSSELISEDKRIQDHGGLIVLAKRMLQSVT